MRSVKIRLQAALPAGKSLIDTLWAGSAPLCVWLERASVRVCVCVIEDWLALHLVPN